MSQEGNEMINNYETNICADEILNEHINEFKKREHVYLSCISSLEKEISQTHTYLNEWRSMHMYDDDDNKSSKDIININSLRNLLIDPSINLEIKELRQKIYDITRKCNLAEEKLQGCNFDSQTTAGQRLINKCKKLQEENYELGKSLEENHLQSVSIQIINLKEQIIFYKNELKMLKELNTDIDEDNELLSQQLAEITKKYTLISEEKNESEKSILKLNNYIDILKSKLRKYDEISKDEQIYKKKNNYYSSNISSENNVNNEINNNQEEHQEEYKDEEEEYPEGIKNNDNEEEEECSNENDSYKKKNSDKSKERKHRKIDKHYYKDKKYDKDKHKLREKEKEKNRKDRTRKKEKTKERTKEKLKEREKIKNKYKNKNKEKARSKTKKEQYDSNYSEQKKKYLKDHNNDFRESSRTDKFEFFNNTSKNGDMEDKASEYGSERERSYKKKREIKINTKKNIKIEE